MCYNQEREVIFPEPVSYLVQKGMKGQLIMAGIKILKNKIPFIITLVCCVTVAALAASVRAADSPKVSETSAQAAEKQVIVLDAGHPTYLNTQTPRIWLNNAV